MSETRGEYDTGQAGAENEAPDNVRSLPARGGFMQIENVYVDRLMGVMSPTSYYVLIYLVRRTAGYHQESVRLTLPQIEEVTQLSRHTILKALADLDAAHIVTSDASQRGRTQIRTYTLHAPNEWHVDALRHDTPAQTSAKNALVETRPSEAPQLVQKMHQTRAKSALVPAQTSAKNAPLLNTREYKDTSKDKTEANASGAATSADAVPVVGSPVVASPVVSPSSTSPSKRPRKLNDAQLAAHRAEQGWCADVLAELCRRLNVREPPRAGQQKAAAKWLYAELRDVPDGTKRVWACYDLTKRDPFWQHKTLLLSDIIRPFPAYRSDPAGYRAAIEASMAEAKRIERTSSRGERHHAPDQSVSGGDTGAAGSADDATDDASRFPDPFERTKQRIAAAVAAKRAQESAHAAPERAGEPQQWQ